MEYSSKYTLVFNSDGTVSCKGYKIIIVVIMKLSQMELLFVHLQNVLIAFHQMDPTEIQRLYSQIVLNSDGTLTSPTGSNGTTNWGKIQHGQKYNKY